MFFFWKSIFLQNVLKCYIALFRKHFLRPKISDKYIDLCKIPVWTSFFKRKSKDLITFTADAYSEPCQTAKMVFQKAQS